MSEMHPFQIPHCSKAVPQVSWALANVICLATGSENDCVDQGQFTQGLNHTSYVHVVNILAENLLDWLEDVGWIRKDNQEIQENVENMCKSHDIACSPDTTYGPIKMSYMDLFRPVVSSGIL
ncbi:E3 ubiquitin-protein ligase UPL7 [Vitis vinifera]|uniref:E3 ubiquitin-protein ligase UPL7 n=1 Tax=Vitis vinifera TaxID=29760 RepID=A0A438JS82_VITVI|nr:E3 ubiquitin-protein ligase UPL7 [Vitis vinifera]